MGFELVIFLSSLDHSSPSHIVFYNKVFTSKYSHDKYLKFELKIIIKDHAFFLKIIFDLDLNKIILKFQT